MNTAPTSHRHAGPPRAEDQEGTFFGLLRHGETQWNNQKRVQGHGDSPLTPTGRRQIQQWAKQLEQETWHHILVSDLGRTRETAAILNSVLRLPITIDSRLREQHWGDWEGLRVADVRQNFATELTRQTQAGWDFCPPGGESRQSVRTRAFQALAEMQPYQTGRKILVICHMGVIKCLLYHIAKRKFLPQESPLLEKNHLHIISCSHGQYRLSRLNIPRRETV